MSAVVQPIVKPIAKVLGLGPSGGSAPAAPTMAQVPSAATPQVQAASMAAQRRERVASGRAATMLTSREDDQMNKNVKVGTARLLGG
jgi:hypothetical protein